ncbi:MAG: hypothetical protein V4510_03605 [bacterium]
MDFSKKLAFSLLAEKPEELKGVYKAINSMAASWDAIKKDVAETVPQPKAKAKPFGTPGKRSALLLDDEDQASTATADISAVADDPAMRKKVADATIDAITEAEDKRKAQDKKEKPLALLKNANNNLAIARAASS